MLSVTPYIVFRGNCREAVDFYKQALGAEVVGLQTFGESPMASRGPADYIVHGTLRIGDSSIMVSDDPRPSTTAAAEDKISMAIGLQDSERAKQIFDSLAQGGSVTMPLQKTYWAGSFGMLTDKFGVKWMINCEGAEA